MSHSVAANFIRSIQTIIGVACAVMICLMAIGCAPDSGARHADFMVRFEESAQPVWYAPKTNAYPIIENVLDGFDRANPDREIGSGGRMLYAVEVDDEHRRRLTSYILVESQPADQFKVVSLVLQAPGREGITIASPLETATITVFDETGSPLVQSESSLPAWFLRKGPFDACQEFVARRDELKQMKEANAKRSRSPHRRADTAGEQEPDRIQDSEEYRRMLEAFGNGTASLMALFRATQANAALHPVRIEAWRTVVSAPNVLSFLTNLGARVVIVPSFEDGIAGQFDAPGLGEAVDAYEFPAVMRINNEDAVYCRLVVAEPVAPLTLGAGLVRLEACHPKYPERTMRITLVAARHGATTSMKSVHRQDSDFEFVAEPPPGSPRSATLAMQSREEVARSN